MHQIWPGLVHLLCHVICTFWFTRKSVNMTIYEKQTLSLRFKVQSAYTQWQQKDKPYHRGTALREQLIQPSRDWVPQQRKQAPWRCSEANHTHKKQPGADTIICSQYVWSGCSHSNAVVPKTASLLLLSSDDELKQNLPDQFLPFKKPVSQDSTVGHHKTNLGPCPYL